MKIVEGRRAATTLDLHAQLREVWVGDFGGVAVRVRRQTRFELVARGLSAAGSTESSRLKTLRDANDVTCV